MTLFDIIFYAFAILTVVSAFITVTSRNIMHAAFGLMFAFFGVATMYILLNADFLAVTQVLVYIGGILVLLLFGVMLTNKATKVDIKTGTLGTLPAAVIIAALAGTMFGYFWNTQWYNGGQKQPIESTAKTLGQLLMTDFLLPFEIASIVLLVAIIGAAIIARKEPAPKA